MVHGRPWTMYMVHVNLPTF